MSSNPEAPVSSLAAFIGALHELEQSIAITAPHELQVQRAYWGGPGEVVADLPAFINALSETQRVVDPFVRDQTMSVAVQLLVAPARAEDSVSSMIATEFWLQMKRAFDLDRTIGGTVFISTLRGADPTVPVILQHAGRAYIGVNAILDFEMVEANL